MFIDVRIYIYIYIYIQFLFDQPLRHGARPAARQSQRLADGVVTEAPQFLHGKRPWSFRRESMCVYIYIYT